MILYGTTSSKAPLLYEAPLFLIIGCCFSDIKNRKGVTVTFVRCRTPPSIPLSQPLVPATDSLIKCGRKGSPVCNPHNSSKASYDLGGSSKYYGLFDFSFCYFPPCWVVHFPPQIWIPSAWLKAWHTIGAPWIFVECWMSECIYESRGSSVRKCLWMQSRVENWHQQQKMVNKANMSIFQMASVIHLTIFSGHSTL